MATHNHTHNEHAHEHSHAQRSCSCGGGSTENSESCCGKGHEHNQTARWKDFVPCIISFVMLAAGISFDHFITSVTLSPVLRLAWYLAAYLPVAIPVVKEAWEAVQQKSFFNEFTLMLVATIGAFCIGEYPEAVAVMLFYAVGELFQGSAVNKAQRSIKALLDVRPDTAAVLRNGTYITVNPQDVSVGETIQVKAGEKVPLDGQMLSAESSFNTSALTGESRPRTIRSGEQVLAGMLNLDRVIEVKVEKLYADSSLSRILEMVQNASSRKAKTELLIRKFAKVYTPIVFALAVLIAFVPALFVADYVFSDWMYRGLVFLVISCPCALVISIPLGYFGGIGAASRNGILFKGANYLEQMTKLTTVVMDKTGTLTQGVFRVQKVEAVTGDTNELLSMVAAVERLSTHPIAKAVAEHAAQLPDTYTATDVEEVAGHGLRGKVNSTDVLVGNSRLMRKYNVAYPPELDSIADTTIIAAVNGEYEGYITIADQPKPDAKDAVSRMHKAGIRKLVMLSGDKDAITQKVAAELGIDEAYGDLLPEDKVKHLERLMAEPESVTAFVGDGINDAPALALADVGVAMGGMGSDAAIEVADVVIQTDQPSKLAAAVTIARATRRIVMQNIALAFGVKALVLLLGALGMANMWQAVFADVGVALLAILNATRILRKKV